MVITFLFSLFLNIGCAPAPAASGPLKPVVHVTVDNTTERVKQIFQASCTRCHGLVAPTKFNILDVKELESKGVVQGGAESKLFKSIATDKMPLGGPPLKFDDKEAILAWLNAGYPAFEGTEPPPTEPIDYGDEVTCAARDAAPYPLHQTKDFKYLTFARYYNEGGVENLTRTVEAATKLLNSVSFSPHIAQMKPVECKGVKNALFRIELPEFNFDNRDWDNFIVRGKYPYFIFYFDKEDFGFFEDQLFQKTDCVKHGECQTIPLVRGDWFVSVVSAAPLYYDALFKRKEVHDVKTLEFLLGVDTQEQIFKTYEARRAIFRRSGVTNYNRVVDSYELDFWIGGAKYPSRYWKTFDTFGDKAQDKKNLFAFPFGPLYAWYVGSFFQDIKDKVFNWDASEHIWTNPNGSLGFWLADGKGARINEALTEVAYHKANTNHYIGSKPGVIVNGTSCFACHSAMNSFKDEGRSYVLASTDFNNAQVDAAKLLFYKNEAEIAAHVNTTNQIYAVASKAMQIGETHPVDYKEPIFATAKQYYDDIGVCELGAELGYDCGEMKTRLLHAPGLALLLGLGETLNGKVSRPNVEYLFSDIAKELNIGKQVIFSGHVDPPPPPVCKLKITNKTAYAQRLDKMVFENNVSYGETWLQVNESKTYSHDSQALVTSCLTYTTQWCVWHKNEVLEKCGSYEIARRSDGKSYFNKVSGN